MRVFVVTILLFLVAGKAPYAQMRRMSDHLMKQKLSRADALLYANTDSSLRLSNEVLIQLRADGQHNTPFGIRVQLTQATALAQNIQESAALRQLLRIEQLSRAKGLRYLHARICLELALLYEINKLKGRSRQQLDQAKIDIDRYGLHAVYPRYAVRISSWQRMFNKKDSAVYFAQEAVRAAPLYGSAPDEAHGYFLLGVLRTDSFDARINYFRKASAIYQKIGNQELHSAMMLNIARDYLQNKNLPLALVYCDSTIFGGHRLMATGDKQAGTSLTQRAYQYRGEVYQRLGRLDSALADMKRGYDLELKGRDYQERDKINEIDARYQTSLHQKQIEEQQLALRTKNEQLRFFLIIALLVAILAVGLFIAYRKQRQARRLLARQNDTIHQQAEQLKTLDVAKSRFFANASHELRTPLTLLLGPVDRLLTENQLTSQQADLLQLARRNGRQLEQLVTDILDLGKLELGKLDLVEKPTPMAAFFRSHLAQFASLAESRHLQYVVDIRVDEQTVGMLDQPKFGQMLNNLLSNAFKFTPAGGCITTTLSLIDNRLNLTVANTGPGIYPDDLPHLFDRYFQTTRPDKPAEGGTGIGLALCQEYAHLFGGDIGVESTVGSGSVFRVTFPVTTLPADAADRHSEAPILARMTSERQAVQLPDIADKKETTPADKATILVVEDNPDLRAYLHLILSDQYRVLTAENGRVALDQLRSSANGTPGVSLILSDLMMPVMDGHQLLEALKANDATRHIPVVMLTARADVRDKLRALRIGVDDYILKPFEESELLARIANLLANQTARQQVVAHEPIPDPARPILSQADGQWLETFEQYVQQHLSDPLLSIPAIADDFAMSESTLLRQVKRLTGLSTQQYVQAVRLEEARRLLESHTGHSIAQVAIKTGYADAYSFARSFKTRFGKAPSALLEA